MLQKHADHRRLGHEGPDLRDDSMVTLIAHHMRSKSGAIIVKDPENAVLNVLRNTGTGIHRQISAFGMSPKPKRHYIRPCEGFHIFDCHPLCGNRLEKAHVEIFLPAGKAVICTAEGKERASIIQEECDRRKLCLVFREDTVCVSGQDTVSKSLAFRRHLQEDPVIPDLGPTQMIR